MTEQTEPSPAAFVVVYVNVRSLGDYRSNLCSGESSKFNR